MAQVRERTGGAGDPGRRPAVRAPGSLATLVAITAGLVRAARPSRHPASRDRRLHLPPDLFADLAHELRTPLATVLGYAEILDADRAALEPAAARMVRAILRGAGRQARGLDSLTALADLDNGDIPARRQPVDLAALLAQLPAPPGEGLERPP